MDDAYYEMSDFDEGFSFSETETYSSSPKTKSTCDDDFDSEFEDDFDLDNVKSKTTDTTAQEARNGKDIQGIPWERLNFTRDKYRETRLKQYKNYENLPSSPRQQLDKICKQVKKGHTFYDFQFNTRLVKSTIVHFQISDGLIIPTIAILPICSTYFNKLKKITHVRYNFRYGLCWVNVIACGCLHVILKSP